MRDYPIFVSPIRSQSFLTLEAERGRQAQLAAAPAIGDG